MKKSLIISALCASISIANAAQASGVFLGANVGLPITTPSYGGSLERQKSILPKSGIGWNLGVNVGYKHALSEQMGLKYYLQYDYNESYGDKDSTGVMGATQVDADIKQNLITFNVDYYMQPSELFGFYAGLGLGYQSFKPSWTVKMTMMNTTITSGSKGGFALPLNLGVNVNLNANHQITLGAKIPLVGYDYKTTLQQAGLGGDANVKLRTYLVQVGYNYTF